MRRGPVPGIRCRRPPRALPPARAPAPPPRLSRSARRPTLRLRAPLGPLPARSRPVLAALARLAGVLWRRRGRGAASPRGPAPPSPPLPPLGLAGPALPTGLGLSAPPPQPARRAPSHSPELSSSSRLCASLGPAAGPALSAQQGASAARVVRPPGRAGLRAGPEADGKPRRRLTRFDPDARATGSKCLTWGSVPSTEKQREASRISEYLRKECDCGHLRWKCTTHGGWGAHLMQ
ncbi:wiskott-Aldrich syndrome protein homolog 1-like [Vulpes lagopus]|uniref:wiskott-Aldrich syndrome protein homolog 1-like n=1 Tax=Vulpes lagopus TaxID=494514 RepID=UPI001BCA5327|nr:wiskott-Aldrich syndrome protein homolog 1-like [Vulpes lagopus]